MFIELTRVACISDPAIIRGLIVGNLLVFITYCLIPVQLFRISRRIKKAGFEMPEHNVSKLFKAFIFSCGCSHLIAALVFFFPIFHAENLVIWVTAAISLFTSWILYRQVPIISDMIIGSILLSHVLDDHDAESRSGNNG
jgi:hypothetical protein